MKFTENILTELCAKLLTEGEAVFSQDGLSIKASYDGGCLNIEASLANPEEDEAQELINSFEEYVKSLSDDFFLEVTESFAEGQLKAIQDKLDSKKLNVVKEGIDLFMSAAHRIAQNKVKEINEEIVRLNTEITERKEDVKNLAEIAHSYIHVMNKRF